MNLLKTLFKSPVVALHYTARIATGIYIIFLIGLFAYLIIKLVITAGGLI